MSADLKYRPACKVPKLKRDASGEPVSPPEFEPCGEPAVALVYMPGDDTARNVCQIDLAPYQRPPYVDVAVIQVLT